LPISWDYYKQRRRVDVKKWLSARDIETKKDFLYYLSAEDIIPPNPDDAEVVEYLKALSKKQDVQPVSMEKKPKQAKPRGRPSGPRAKK
jgi:hypothetical protein